MPAQGQGPSSVWQQAGDPAVPTGQPMDAAQELLGKLVGKQITNSMQEVAIP